MQKKLLLLLCLFSVLLSTNELEAQHRCGTDHYMENLLKDPDFAEKFYKQREEIRVSAMQKAMMPCTNPLIIPVAVHYGNSVTTANTACLVTAAQEQINQMNLDFSSCNANAGDLCSWINAGCTNFGGTAGADAMPIDGACIQFCLADQNLPAGEDNIGGFGITVGDYTWSGSNADTGNNWDGYLNIFVGTYIAGGTLGVAPLSGGANPSGNGVYVLASAFGATGFSGCTSGTGIGTDPVISGGATCTHEVGHYFGLEHTFSDSVADTPPQSCENYGSPNVNTSTCTASGCSAVGGCTSANCSNSGTGYSANFMDYVNDDYMSNFSADQVAIMQSTAAAQNVWTTNSISCFTNWQNGTNTYASCVSGPCGNVNPPVASFTPVAGAVSFCTGSTLDFTDTSTGVPTSWSWSFSGAGISSTSTVQNPSVTPTATGTLNVTLTVTNANGSDNTSATYSVTVLPASDPTCQTPPCLITNNGPFLIGTPSCATSCAAETTTFEVYTDESYLLGGLTANETYTFDICNGYDPAVFMAVLTIAQVDPVNGGVLANSELAWAAGCTVSFTVPTSGDYIAIISEENNCGGAQIATDNGFPSITCAGTQSTSVFTDQGGFVYTYLPNQNVSYTLCPSNAGGSVTLTFTSFDIEDDPTCQYDIVNIYDGPTTTSTSLGGFCGTTIPGPFTSSDASGCITVEMISDNTVQGTGWEATVDCGGGCNANENFVSGVTQTGTLDYEASVNITSEATIQGSTTVVDYDAGVDIDLLPNFCVQLGAEFHAFIDGCGGAMLQEDEAARMKQGVDESKKLRLITSRKNLQIDGSDTTIKK